MEEFDKRERRKLKNIVRKIRVMSATRGIVDDFFKVEGRTIDENIYAMWSNDLRWYCLKFQKEVVIFGGGGIKPEGTRTYQDVPELDKEVQLLRDIGKQIDERIREKGVLGEKLIWIENSRIKGDLSFN